MGQNSENITQLPPNSDTKPNWDQLKALAESQGGYFTSRQALELGYSHPNQTYHVKKGNWQRVEFGIYRLPWHENTYRAQLFRWSFWTRNRQEEIQGAISHESALYYHRLQEQVPAQFHLTVPPGFRKTPPPEVILHKAELPAEALAAGEPLRVVSAAWAQTQVQPDLAATASQAAGAVRTDPLAFPGLALAEKPTELPAEPSAPQAAFPSSLPKRSLFMRAENDRDQRGRRAGFTLVELLVVTAIISVLAAMLLPALERALLSARGASCQNQLKQIGTCLELYSGDNEGWLPSIDASIWLVNSHTWPNWLQVYIPEEKLMREVVTCPSYKRLWFDNGNYGLSYHWFKFSSWNKPRHRWSECQKPSGTLFATDVWYEGTNTLSSDQIMTGAVQAVQNMHYRHLSGANVLWGDLHVSGYREPPTSDANAPIWKGK